MSDTEHTEQEPARVKCVIEKKTEKALLIRQEQARGEVVKAWIPRSVLDHVSVLGFNKENQEHKDATIEMPDWLAEERGLDYQ